MAPPRKSRRAAAGPSLRDIVREEMVREIEMGEKFAFERLERIHPLGIFLLRPLTYALMAEYRRRDSRRVRGQLDTLLKAAEWKMNGHGSAAVNRRYLGEYLRNDLIHRRANRRSKNFGALRNLLGELFVSRVDMIARLMGSRGGSYEELTRDAFRTRREAERFLAQQLAIHDDIIRLFEEDAGLLRIPGPVRGHILRVVRETYEYAKERVSERMDEIFTNSAASTPKRSSGGRASAG